MPNPKKLLRKNTFVKIYNLVKIKHTHKSVKIFVQRARAAPVEFYSLRVEITTRNARAENVARITALVLVPVTFSSQRN